MPSLELVVARLPCFSAEGGFAWTESHSGSSKYSCEVSSCPVWEAGSARTRKKTARKTGKKFGLGKAIAP